MLHVVLEAAPALTGALHVQSEVQGSDCAVLRPQELPPHCLLRAGRRGLQHAAHLAGAVADRPRRGLCRPRQEVRENWPPLQEPTADEEGGGRLLRGRVPSHLQIHQRQLQYVLKEVAVRLGAAICALVPLQEVCRRRAAEAELQSREHGNLHRQDVLLGASLLGNEDKVPNIRWINLLELCCDEGGAHDRELKVLPPDPLGGQEAVKEAHGQEESLCPQLELDLHLNEPVHRHRPHVGRELWLRLHVLGPGHLRAHLIEGEPITDVQSVLRHVLRVVLHVAHDCVYVAATGLVLAAAQSQHRQQPLRGRRG
mmetsp:Transcript_92994/g.277596  ORF Transcript_92994/g.277596 Transcript_92994/m.277596 type:complete len:312 (+) Transcript_92994:106-1041(+)